MQTPAPDPAAEQVRRPIVAGNWKMNTTRAEAVDLARALASDAGFDGVDTVVCPPFPWLAAVGDVVAGSAIALGAQNCYPELKGAFTGEVSPAMLVDLGCRYVIVGHSERRTLLGESDDLVARKVRAALGVGLTPIVCVGEDLAQNEAGETDAVVQRQIRAALAGLEPQQVAGAVVAYEPIWAIGTGRAATAADAGRTIGVIRRAVEDVAGERAAGAVRIQYGGSVTAANAAELFAQAGIDGALVGGASLKAADFSAICRAAATPA